MFEKQNQMKKKLVIAILVLVILVNLPLLHQDIETGRVQFSIAESIETDISEQQFLTPTFILEAITPPRAHKGSIKATIEQTEGHLIEGGN